jgi:hypothetical protein
MRPGTVTWTSPQAMSGAGTPISCRTAAATSALVTLKSPAMDSMNRRSPAGPVAANPTAPDRPYETSVACQSAACPVAETVVTGTRASPASRRPYSSSTATTARRHRSGVNSDAFAA